MKEQIVFVKRGRASNSIMYNQRLIKMEMPQGRFTISLKAASLLGVGVDDGLMFGFNRAAHTAYVVKDDEPDAFIIRRKDEGSFRFASKNLQEHFQETFNLFDVHEKTHYFQVAEKATGKGLHELKITQI